MTHTSEGIASSDFVMRDLDLNREPEMQRESKILAGCMDSIKRK